MSIPTTTDGTLRANSPGPHPPGVSTTDTASSPKKAAEEPIADIDIEHVPVDDDPRKWSRVRKTITLWIVSAASLISTLASNIQNPSNALIAHDMHATNVQISWTLAGFIIVQGNLPLVWSVASEIKGRKLVYVAATTIFVLASVIVANARTISVLIGMRVVQAAGSSAALAISAATLADIYETHERGTMMGIYYAAPLLGPALGPIVGASLSEAFGWAASFYFLGACGGVLLVAFIFLFKDTFRIERSLTYQAVLHRRTITTRDFKPKTDFTIAEGNTGTEEKQASGKKGSPQPSSIEDGTVVIKVESGLNDVRLSISDINPIPPFWKVVRERHNLAILLANGLVFAFSYSLSYTCTRTLSMQYNLDPLSVGIVLLSLGAGSIGGSVIGGRWSDHVVTKMTNENGGKWYPEMRLKSATLAMVWLPPSVIGYGWVAEKHADVGVICLMVFLCGFFSIWMYSSTLAYVVDANPGRSCSAVAANSSFRGTLAFISTMVAVPLQDALGDGWLYTGFAVLVILMELLIVLVLRKGVSWREQRV
ncbi:major facilitator superfamily domain-containing protein [Boletus edulis]|nr:major facilitator superfamily domain-containing protein [Boletus edulis]